MLKKDLLNEVASLTGRSKRDVSEVLEAATTAVLTALAGGASVMLLGLGKLSVAQRGPKTARNLHTGAPVTVPPRRVALLRPSDAVNLAIN